jgi:hypothetical protein
VRATDSLGRCQPEVAPDNEDGYFFSAVLRTPVTVAEDVTRSYAATSRPDRVASTRPV